MRRPNSPGWQAAFQTTSTVTPDTWTQYVKGVECALRGRAVLAAEAHQLALAKQKETPATK